jgi:hypothetical protein
METDMHPIVAEFRSELKSDLAVAVGDLVSSGAIPMASWPMATTCVIRLAECLGYEVSPSSIDGAIQRGRIGRPSKKGREFLWSRELAIDLLMDCERRRSWLPTSTRHQSKMTCFEQAESVEKIQESWRSLGLGNAPSVRPDYLSLSGKQLVVEMVDGEMTELRRWARWCFRRRIGLPIGGRPLDDLIAATLDRIAEEASSDQRAHMGELLIGWLNQCSEGDLQFHGAESPPTILMSDMLAGLRSESDETRLLAGLRLATSLGAGLAMSDASELDAEHGAGKDLSNLLGKAMAGDAEAVDELERVITNDPSKIRSSPCEHGRKLDTEVQS